MKELVLLKLGGSLITDKTRPYTPLLEVMDDLSQQIVTALRSQPDLRLVLGHGAGSFGHVAASEYKTRDGYPVHPLSSTEDAIPPKTITGRVLPRSGIRPLRSTAT